MDLHINVYSWKKMLYGLDQHVSPLWWISLHIVLCVDSSIIRAIYWQFMELLPTKSQIELQNCYLVNKLASKNYFSSYDHNI
jgi:hypothetical protein